MILANVHSKINKTPPLKTSCSLDKEHGDHYQVF